MVMVGAVDLLFPRDQLLAGARGLASANGFSLRLLCLARARGPSFPARLPLPMPLRQPRGVNRLGEWRDVRRADSSLVKPREWRVLVDCSRLEDFLDCPFPPLRGPFV